MANQLMQFLERATRHLILLGLSSLLACHHVPTLMPVAPAHICTLSNGDQERAYDRNHDQQPDYVELLTAGGRVRQLQVDGNQDGQLDDPIAIDNIPVSDSRQLFIILDSIPFQMVQDLWQQGRFRYFHPPRRIIAPFPVMTDLSLAEFFGVSPSPGVESAHFDGAHLTDPFNTYATGANAPWLRGVDHFQSQDAHMLAYLWPMSTYLEELHGIETTFFQDPSTLVMVYYMVSTSAQGAKYGRNGQQSSLVTLDRFCQALMARTQGRLQITLLSDHGHNLRQGTFIQLSSLLPRLGYRVGDRLETVGDVVIPEWGLVTCAALHTHEPAQLAVDVLGLEGIDLAAYANDQDQVVVLSRGGQASITHRAGTFCYQCQYGDPLQLLPVLSGLTSDSKEFIDDRAWFDATLDHTYPDPIHRLWRAFHGLVENTPQVLLSLDEDHYCGSDFLLNFINLQSAHGSLHQSATYGFVMTTAGELPPTMRMDTLAVELEKLGLQPRYKLQSSN